MHHDVIVVGAGMVGLTAALLLVQHSFKVALVEANEQPIQTLPTSQEAFDSRVVAISRASKHLFEKCEVWATIQQSRSCAYQHMKVWDCQMDGKIHFSAADFFEPDLGHIIEQRVILAALWQKLTEYKEINYFFGTKPQNVTQHEKLIELELASKQKLTGALIIAADGANSVMRNLCKIQISGWDYQQQAIIATVEGSKGHNKTAFQRFSQDGSLALLPLDLPNYSSIVWATSIDKANDLLNCDEALFNERLQREIENVMGMMTLIGKRYAFSLRTHHAKHYVVERCAFVGDAAHTLHPLAGQGVNLGLLDVASLVEVISVVKDKGRDIGSKHNLARFERDRKLHNQVMIWAMEAFKRGFLSQNNLVQRLRNFGLNFVDKRVMLKQIFAQLAMGTFWKGNLNGRKQNPAV